MTQSVPEYFTLLPSEICRLVLGYLVHSGPESAAKVLFSESIHLSELRAQYKTVTDLPLHLTQFTLLDLVYDYLRIANSVAHQLSKLGVVCRLGAVSTVLPHLLKTNPNASAGRRISPVFPTRPSWMPLGKTYLPPRIVHGEPKGPVRLPLLAVRPHLYSDGVSGVPGSRTSSATDVPSQLPSIVSIQGNVGIPRVLSSEPSSSSTSNSRPVIRLYRNPVGTGPPSVLNMVEEQKLDEASDVLSSSPPCSQTTAPTEHSEPTPTDTNPELLPAEETERVVVDEPTVSLPEDPIAEAEEVPPSPVDASDEEVEQKLETSVETGIESTTEVKSESQAPFTVFQHLPPPTETPAVPSVDVTCDRASDEAISKASSKTKRRRWIPPRHMVTAPEVPEATGTTSAAESSSAEDDVDLERFIAALLDHPEQVAGHINAKIGGQSKSVVVQTHPLRLSPPKSSHSCFSSTRPVRSSSPEDQILTDNSLSPSSMPLHPPHSSVPTSNDPGAALLNVDDLDFCIDQLLSEFDAADAEMEDLPDQLIPSATPVPTDVVELSVPSRASTPAVLPAANPKQSEPKFNSRLASKSPRRPASPLCLSQLTRTAVVAESPNKRRRFYASEAHNGGALRTPDGKIPDFGPQQVQSLQKDLFSTECAMQFYEEFVGFDRTPTVSTTDDSRFSIPTKPRTTGVQIATSHCPIDMVQLTSVSASLHTGDPGGEVQRWFPETLPNNVACFATAPPLSSTVMSTASPICVPSSILPHISTLLPAVEHRRPVCVNSTDVGVGKPLLPSTFFTGTPESHTTISTATSTLTGSVSRPPTLQFTSVGSTNGAPQTILFYPTVHPTVTSTVTPVRREALRGLNLATNVSSSSNILTVPSISNLGSIENLDGKPVIIHLPPSASIVGTSVSGQLQTVCLPPQSQWTGQQTTIILPFNVDLDSPNPYSLLQSSGSANSAPKGVVPTVTDKENRPPLVVQTSSRRKVLNLGSLDVDHILSQSH
ncbi:hypothetical protein T265_07690 [Opisthorchis viverrini]|uniref:Uncharacterized protein n=1 Tax=Opisthorchis viverrini TaxID=6198 RepID=A0A074ZGB7_OPIVI|nr:hypothetical protein T265_07690 [Opisthorchis viverrini]KER24687.1 hypothetical protein T265_07690 [Opisthorchis viverrini]